MNFYKRHIGDYMKDTAHLSLLEHGIYTRLLDVYYTRESGIPHEQAARLIGARTKEERQGVDSVLSEFFTLVDGMWTQERCEREIANANDKANRNREVGRLGGRPKPTGNPDGLKKEPTNNPDGYFSKPTDNPIQTPDSRLQTPITRKKKEDRAQALADATAVLGLDVESFSKWLEYRRLRKPEIRTVSLRACAEELAAFGEQQAEVVRHSIANSYQGLFAPKPAQPNGRAPPAPLKLKTAEEWEAIERERGEHAAN